MLRDLGCEFVIVGHSERRRDHNEDDPLIGMKAQHAYRAGLRPIVCIGETLSQRQEGSTFAVLERQLEGIISAANPDVVASSIIAYEPVWAIGTGLAATAEQAQEVHAYIRAHLHGCGITTGVPLLYGGSVTANNAAELFTCRDIDGALVGGASLIADQFTSIVNAAKKA
jgi:triosephosphate isomerase